MKRIEKASIAWLADIFYRQRYGVSVEQHYTFSSQIICLILISL